MSISSKDILKRAAQGDREAFGDLYETFLGEIYRYIFFRVYDKHHAEDLTETVFLKAWEGLTQKKPKAEIKNLRAWIYRIAHNTVIDFHRTQKANVPIDDLPSHAEPHSPPLESIVNGRLANQALIDNISKLEPNYQQVILLRFINQFSHAETAEILGTTAGNVRIMQYRALKKLRVMMDEENGS